MAEESDEAEKSHEPTPRKLQKAREKGDVPKSQDLHASAAYLGLMLAIMATTGPALMDVMTALSIFLDQSDRLAEQMFSGDVGNVPLQFTSAAAFLLAGFFSAPVLFVILSAIAQQSVTFSPQKIQPKLSKVSVLSNAKQKFGIVGLVEFAKSFAKMVIVSVILAVFLISNLDDILHLVALPSFSTTEKIFELLLQFLAMIILISFGIGLLDYVFQFHNHRKKLRMSRKEVQDESKDMEGDPHLKSKRRQKAQEIANSINVAAVSEADVIITNPTHYSIALQWSRRKGEAPVCVAKGVDEMARMIREKAMEAGVPIHEDPPTARALYATTEVDDEIPTDLYRAVATAIRFAEKIRSHARARPY